MLSAFHVISLVLLPRLARQYRAPRIIFLNLDVSQLTAPEASEKNVQCSSYPRRSYPRQLHLSHSDAPEPYGHHGSRF